MKHLILFYLLLFSFTMYSQDKEIIYLWPGIVPGEPEVKQSPVIEAREDDVLMYTKITNPALEVYLPDPSVSNGSAVIVCPGGGYHILAYDKEGSEIAEWLNKLGFTAFVLQYRIPDKKEGALQDVQRAFRIVRKDAKKWSIDPYKIGVIGFSAGGSLSARASTLFNKKTYIPVDNADSLSCRPDFTLLIYPAYLDEGTGRTLTPELKLSKEVPPVYIFQTADDVYGNSALVMAGALRDAGLPVELHILPFGGHGYGLRPGTIAASTWPGLAENWLSAVQNDKK
jgi:acetyl esterase/lipase